VVVDEWLATSSNEKSERRKAASSSRKQTTTVPVRAYTERRPESIQARPPRPPAVGEPRVRAP
jgi:hypothetical protein